MKTCAALLKSHSLSCRHLCQRSDILNCNWSYITADTTFSHTHKENLTFGTIPGSCETSVRRLWASPAVVQWGWGQDWKTELELVQQMLVGSLLLWPSGWRAGHSRCRDCYRRNTGGAIWLFVDGMFDVELRASSSPPAWFWCDFKDNLKAILEYKSLWRRIIARCSFETNEMGHQVALWLKRPRNKI